jgi:hypothetical protein
MAKNKNKNKTGSTPQNNAAERERGKKSDAANEGSPKPDAGSGGVNQKSDRGRDSEDRFNNDADAGTPKGGAARGSQSAGPDWDPDRIDEDDMDVRPGKPTPRNR